MKEHCCKKCLFLQYYDGYYCDLGIRLNFTNGNELIKDIENTKCEMFEKRKSKFWLYDGAEF